MLASPGVGPDFTGKSSPEVYSAIALGEERCQMRYRIVFIVGLGVGYVLGTRAGRERYEQLRTLPRKATHSPAVQQAPGALHAQPAAFPNPTRPHPAHP